MPQIGANCLCRAMLLLLPLTLSAGCLGPAAVRQTRLRYNEVYRRTNDEQLLLNIVRLRYADSPIFIDLPNITSQFEVTARGSYAGGLDGQGPGRTNLGLGELFLRDAPTLTYHPRDGREVAAALITPISAEVLRALSPGANTELFLLMSVSDINDVPNAPRATSFAPRVPDDNSEFRYGLSLLAALQERDAVELVVTSYDADRFDSIPVGNVSSRDILAAAQNGYAFRIQDDRAELRKREKSVALRVRPWAVDSADVQEFARLFRLAPGRTVYRIKAETEDVEDLDDTPKPIEQSDVLYMNMRSPLQMMSFLSRGVCVPPEHIEKRIAPVTTGPDGLPFDWTQLTRGMFAVRAQKHKPANTEVSVHYRGYWFYVPQDDIQSRAALAMIELLFAAQESETENRGPLLTLPIN